MPTRFWGDVQRARYGRFPDAIGEDDIARCFHLDERDQAIITELRGAHNRLGFPRPSPRRTPTSARPQFRIGLLQRLMSVDRSSRTHGPRSGGRRRRVEAVPKRGAARAIARTPRTPEIPLNRGEHPESDARESRVLRDRTPTREVGTPAQPRTRPRGLRRRHEAGASGLTPRPVRRRPRRRAQEAQGRSGPFASARTRSRELVLDLDGFDVRPPCAFDPVPHLRHPPIAPGAKRLLRRERRANRPQAHRRGERPPAHRGEDGVARDREALCEQPHPRLAVRKRTVPVPGVDPVGAKETVQRLARKALHRPRNFRPRARPGPRTRGRKHPLDERPVEPRVVRDDERARRLDVDPLGE